MKKVLVALAIVFFIGGIALAEEPKAIEPDYNKLMALQKSFDKAQQDVLSYAVAVLNDLTKVSQSYQALATKFNNAKKEFVAYQTEFNKLIEAQKAGAQAPKDTAPPAPAKAPAKAKDSPL